MAYGNDAFDSNPITTGILAGMRLATLQEELKQSRLERAEFEATEGHRQTMRMLAEERGRSENNLLGLQNESQKLNQQILQEQLGQEKAQGPLRTMGLGLQNLLTGTQIAGERQDQKLRGKADQRSEKLARSQLRKDSAEVKQTESATRGNLAQAAILERELASGVGKAAGETDFNDYVQLAKNALEANGVKFKEGDATHQLWTMQIKASAEAMKEERDQNRAVNRQTRGIALAQQAQENALTLLNSKNPTAALETYVDVYKDQPELVQLTRTYVENELESQRAAEQRADLNTAQERQLSEIYDQRNILFGQVNALRAKQESGQRLGSEEKVRLKQVEAQLRDTDKEIAKLREALAPKRKSRKPATTNVEQLAGPPRLTTNDEVAKLKPGTKFIWTDGKEYVKQ